MSKNQDQNDYDDDVFQDTESTEESFDLDFNDSKAMKKQHKAKTRRDTRHRLEDYFERKALKAQQDEWDSDFDYDF